MKDKRVYVTRDTYLENVQVWPPKIGIRKWPGCISYGAGWCSYKATSFLSEDTDFMDKALWLTPDECRERFGFYPKKGQAWYINQRGARTQVFLEFSP